MHFNCDELCNDVGRARFGEVGIWLCWEGARCCRLRASEQDESFSVHYQHIHHTNPHTSCFLSFTSVSFRDGRHVISSSERATLQHLPTTYNRALINEHEHTTYAHHNAAHRCRHTKGLAALQRRRRPFKQQQCAPYQLWSRRPHQYHAPSQLLRATLCATGPRRPHGRHHSHRLLSSSHFLHRCRDCPAKGSHAPSDAHERG